MINSIREDLKTIIQIKKTVDYFMRYGKKEHKEQMLKDAKTEMTKEIIRLYEKYTKTDKEPNLEKL